MVFYKYEQGILILCCYLWLLAPSSVSVLIMDYTQNYLSPPPQPTSHNRPIQKSPALQELLAQKILGEMLEFKHSIFAILFTSFYRSWGSEKGQMQK